MSGNDFEKQVQQRMEELKFIPSDAVWNEVEKEINKKKDRRRLLIWLPLLGLLIGAAVWSLMNTGEERSFQVIAGNKTNNEASDKSTIQADTRNSHVTSSTEKNTSVSKENTTLQKNNNSEQVAENKNTATIETSSNSNNKNVPKTIKKETSAGKHSLQKINNNNTASLAVKQYHRSKKIKNQRTNQSNQQRLNDVANTRNNNANETTEKEKAIEQQESNGVGNVKDNNTGSILSSTTTAATNKVAQQSSVTTATTKTDSSAVVASPPKKNNKKKKIEWGIEANAGASSVINNLSGLFGSNSTLPDAVSYSFSASVNNSSLAPRAGTGVLSPAPTPSNVKPGPAFSTGFVARMPVSKTIKLFTGLRYAFFSSNLMVGDKVTNSALIVFTATGQKNVTTYYTQKGINSRNFLNKYHFIELPVGISKQFGTKSKISVDAGLSLAYLAGSNALIYDPQYRVYYNNNDVLKSAQLNFFTGVAWNITGKKTTLQLGPQLQYGITNLLKSEVNDDRHLFSGGINAKLFFHRKH